MVMFPECTEDLSSFKAIQLVYHVLMDGAPHDFTCYNLRCVSNLHRLASKHLALVFKVAAEDCSLVY